MDRDVRAGVTVMLCGFAGIVLAALEKLLYDEGILLAALEGAITDMMAGTIIVWLLIGVILAVVSR